MAACSWSWRWSSALVWLVVASLHAHAYLRTPLQQHQRRGYRAARPVQMVVALPPFMTSLLRKASSASSGTLTTGGASAASASASASAAASASATASASVELPWATSVSPKRSLAYMPALATQLDLIRALGMKCVSVEERFVHQSSTVKPARIGNLCFESDKFRKVRLTYFDAGESVQVFNALWYPAFEYDAPLLGVDLISLGPTRVLSVVDFQPLHPTAEYSVKYIAPLEPIRSKYPDLHGKMSGKFYDDTSFFSSQMLFGRFTDESKVDGVVLPSHAEYLAAYVDLVLRSSPNVDPAAVEVVKARQAAYDTYSAAKDPAVGLFDAYFGQQWSRDFVYDFLFDRATPPSSAASQSTHSFKVDAQTGVPTISPKR